MRSGLFGYSALKVLAPAFYASTSATCPMFVSFLSIAVNAGIQRLVHPRTETRAHRAGGLHGDRRDVNFLLLYGLLRRHVGRLDTIRTLRESGRVALAALLMGALCLAAWHVSAAWFLTAGVPAQAGWMGLVVGLAGLCFFGLARWFRVEEATVVLAGIRRKIKGA